MSPISFCNAQQELTESTTTLQSDSNVTDYIPLSMANFMASYKPQASTSVGESAQ